MQKYRVKFIADFIVDAENKKEAYDQFEEQIDLSQVKIEKVLK